MPDVAKVTAQPYPFSPPDRLHLDPRYAELRRTEPLIRVRLPFGEEGWLATRHTDVRAVLGDARFSRAASVGRDEPRLTPRQIEGGILSMDPPEHTRLRRLVAKAFTARRVEQLRPRTRQIADELIDAMVADGPPADLVEHFATPLPIQVICELLGVPFADQHLFHVWSEAIVSTTSLPPERIQEYLDNLYAYIGELVQQRRRAPTDDLICAMVRARDEDQDRFTEQEIVQLAAGLLAAGHETTVTQLPNFAYVLLNHPEQLAWLRSDPARVPTAIEELMRYVPLGVASSFRPVRHRGHRGRRGAGACRGTSDRLDFVGEPRRDRLRRPRSARSRSGDQSAHRFRARRAPLPGGPARPDGATGRDRHARRPAARAADRRPRAGTHLEERHDRPRSGPDADGLVSAGWRIDVDARRCIGSGGCVGMAPAHFRLEAGSATPIAATVEPDETVIDAAESCPVEAITVRDDDGGLVAPA